MEMAEHLVLLVVAVVANLLSAMAGGGAGLLQLPALIFLGLPFSMALATHKIATVALGLGATVKHSREKHLRLKFALFILATGLPGVLVGAKVILSVPDNIAKITLGVLTIALGVYSHFKKELGQVLLEKNRHARGMLIGGVVLFIIGFINGSLASGAGLFVTLWMVAWFGLDYKRAMAYKMILVGVFWNGTGALAVAVMSPVKWSWLPALLVGSVIGGYCGTYVAIRYGNPFIKRIFEIITIVAGVSLIANAMQGTSIN